tara:strand:- start:135 stop:791 length:657 start_codon:yes stop_codon:yes gene_type:complete
MLIAGLKSEIKKRYYCQNDLFLDNHISDIIYKIENTCTLDFIEQVHAYKEYLEDDYISDDWLISTIHDGKEFEYFINYDEENILINAMEEMKFLKRLESIKNEYFSKNGQYPIFNNENIRNSLDLTNNFIDFNSFNIYNIKAYNTYINFFDSHLKLFLPTIWKYKNIINVIDLLNTFTYILNRELNYLIDSYKSNDDYYFFVLNDSIYEDVIWESFTR